MSKKRKSQTARQPTDLLVAQADERRQAGRFREAVDLYKQLLKREDRAEWREALAESYLGRAEQLAAKGMFKEAAALWENMAGACGERRLERYIDWLLQAGRIGRGVRLFTEADAAFRDSPAGRELTARIAGLLLCGSPEIAGALPADSPLLSQCDNMLAALQAWCRGDDAAMQQSLRTIPFRSPYRDLRVILQALSSLAGEPRNALDTLQRVPAQSAYARLAEWVRIATLDGRWLLEAVAPLDETARTWVLTLKGWDEARIESLRRLPDPRDADAKALFKFAMGGKFDPERQRRFCQDLLPHYPAGLSAFERRFGVLPPLQRQRIQALVAERRDDLESAIDHWEACVRALTQGKPSGDQKLQAALILRHIAELTTQLRGMDPWDQTLEQHLAHSLELDPEDKATYLALMDRARQREDPKAQDRWAERAVRQFPEDAEVLLVAGLAACRRGAFKKAAGYAGALLARDSINPSARTLLISCHLAHARKQIKARKYHLAERELNTAAGEARDREQRGRVALNQGVLALARNQDPEAEALLRQGIEDLGGGVAAQLRFLVDGHRAGLTVRALSNVYERLQGRVETVTAQELVQVAGLLHRYAEEKVQDLPAVLERLRKPLQAATGLEELPRQELDTVLDAFYKVGHYRLLTQYASAALQRFDQQPRWVFYQVVGRAGGQRRRLGGTDFQRLHLAMDEAEDDEDYRTAELIRDFLGLMPPFPGGLPPLNLDRMINEIMDDLNIDDPETLIEMLREKLGDPDDLPPFPLPEPRGRRKK